MNKAVANTRIDWIANRMPPDESAQEAFDLMRPDIIRKVRQFHASFPQYRPTPLVALHHLAAM